MMFRKMMVAGALLLLVVGCTSKAPASRGVAAAQQTLTLAYKAADVYARLPRCGSPGATVICSDQGVLDEMVAKGRTATAAIDAAKSNSALVDDAWTSVLDFQTFIATKTTAAQ